MSRPSDALAKYDEVITIRSSQGLIPAYKFIEKYLYITDPDGNRIQFILNEDQVDLYKEMCEQKLGGDPVRINILKARQKGFSTFIAAIIFVLTIFVPGRKAAIVADIAEHASNLFEKYNFFFDNLPTYLQPNTVKSNAKELVVKYQSGLTSSIRIMVQGDTAGRSGTYQFLHLSECAFWGDLEDTLTSLLQTVSSSNLDSMVFLETTANGANEYKERWDRDVIKGKTNFIAKFYPWFTTERYRVPDYKLKDFAMEDWEYEIQEKYNLSKAQMQFIHEKYLDFNGNLDRLRQEFPSNSVEAFITSGNSVFVPEQVAKQKERVLNNPKPRTGLFTFAPKWSEDKKVCTVTNIEFIESKAGSVQIFEEPIEGHPYVVSNDPANGGEDYFVSVVFNNHTGKLAAMYRRNKCDIDDAGYQTYCLIKMYNDAMVTGETNTTSYLLEFIRCCGHTFMYQDQDVEDLSNRYINKYGYKTKQNNRNYMIDLFRLAFRENPECITSYEALCEMETFQVVRNNNTGKEKIEAAGKGHDDIVMAICGYYYCRHAQTTIVIQKEKKAAAKYIDLDFEPKNKEIDVEGVYQIWD